MAKKVYVDVILKQDKKGNTRPLSITWTDGSVYEIDQLKQVCRASSRKVSGCGMRYTVVICAKERYIYEEDGRWFVEAK